MNGDITAFTRKAKMSPRSMTFNVEPRICLERTRIFANNNLEIAILTTF